MEGLEITGSIQVLANDVTIRNSVVRSDSFYVIRADYGATNLLIEDVEIDGLGSPTTIGLAGSNWTARRIHVRGVGDGVRMDDNTVLEESYIHDFAVGAGSHNDGAQVTGGQSIVIRGNAIVNDQSQTSAVIIKSDLAPIMDVEVRDNLLDGGAYALYVRRGEQHPVSQVTVAGNRFGQMAEFGPMSIDVPVAWEENRMLGAEALIPLNDGQ